MQQDTPYQCKDLLISHSNITEALIIDDHSIQDLNSSYRKILKNKDYSINNVPGDTEGFPNKKERKTFKCEVTGCEKIYKSKENLNLHIKNIHLNLKPYRCRFCSSTFSHRNGNILFK